MYIHVKCEHVSWGSVGAITNLDLVLVPSVAKEGKLVVQSWEKQHMQQPNVPLIVHVQTMV